MPHTLSLRQVETFLCAARLGSFARAAAHLNATQSAVSMRIREIEEMLGRRLFDRSQRQVRLTAEGLALVPLAEEVVAAADRFIAAGIADTQHIAGHVRLGVTENVAVTWLGAMMQRLHDTYPLIRVELEIAISYELEAKLQSRLLDMAFGACQLPASKYRSRLLQSVDFRWMASPQLEGVPDVLTPENVVDLPVLAVTRAQDASGSLLEWHRTNNVNYRNVTICNSFRTTAAMAIDRLGLTQLPMRLFAEELRKGSLRVLTARPEIPLLDILSIRPLTADSLAHRAVEDVALVSAAPFNDLRPE